MRVGAALPVRGSVRARGAGAALALAAAGLISLFACEALPDTTRVFSEALALRAVGRAVPLAVDLPAGPVVPDEPAAASASVASRSRALARLLAVGAYKPERWIACVGLPVCCGLSGAGSGARGAAEAAVGRADEDGAPLPVRCARRAAVERDPTVPVRAGPVC